MSDQITSDSEQVLTMLARVVGVCDGPGTSHGSPYPEVMTDDDEHVRLPLTEYGASVVADARRMLAEHGREATHLEPMGS